jgi:hypothetical protein
MRLLGVRYSTLYVFFVYKIRCIIIHGTLLYKVQTADGCCVLYISVTFSEGKPPTREIPGSGTEIILYNTS